MLESYVAIWNREKSSTGTLPSGAVIIVVQVNDEVGFGNVPDVLPKSTRVPLDAVSV